MASNHDPRAGRRLPFMSRSRLMPATLDPLDRYGLPSKGETRLNDFKAQEVFYHQIVERFATFCKDAGGPEELERRFSTDSVTELNTGIGAMNISTSQHQSNEPSTIVAATKTADNSSNRANGSTRDWWSSGSTGSGRAAGNVSAIESNNSRNIANAQRKDNDNINGSGITVSTARSLGAGVRGNGRLRKVQSQALQRPGPQTQPQTQQTSTRNRTWKMELSTITHAMRVLRESIVATSRKDVFAQRAYVFLVQSCILTRQRESYHPALLYLLQNIHPHSALSPSELHEFVGYHILDLACRQGDMNGAYHARQEWKYNDRRLDRILTAIIRGEWLIFWRIRRTVDGYVRALLEYRADEIRKHAMKCLATAYFTAEKSYIEACTNSDWKNLVEKCNVAWTLDEQTNTVTMRRPKTK